MVHRQAFRPKLNMKTRIPPAPPKPTEAQHQPVLTPKLWSHNAPNVTFSWLYCPILWSALGVADGPTPRPPWFAEAVAAYSDALASRDITREFVMQNCCDSRSHIKANVQEEYINLLPAWAVRLEVFGGTHCPLAVARH